MLKDSRVLFIKMHPLGFFHIFWSNEASCIFPKKHVFAIAAPPLRGRLLESALHFKQIKIAHSTHSFLHPLFLYKAAYSSENVEWFQNVSVLFQMERAHLIPCHLYCWARTLSTNRISSRQPWKFTQGFYRNNEVLICTIAIRSENLLNINCYWYIFSWNV